MHINHKNIYSQSLKETRDLQVKKQIEEVFNTHPAYGHRRLAIELRMNKKKVRRIMRKYRLTSPRLWYHQKYLTKSNSEFKNQFDNLIKNIKWPKENEIWASDLTYIKFQNRFIYLSAIQDISTSEIVSCNLGDKHNSELVLKTIRQAIRRYGKLPKIFHSDRGTEYLNESCLKFLKENNIQVSVSDPGSPWQNGHSESFFSRLKAETGNLNRFEDLGELTEYIYHYISYFNKDRIITRLKTSPIKYKQSLRKCS